VCTIALAARDAGDSVIRRSQDNQNLPIRRVCLSGLAIAFGAVKPANSSST